MSTPTSLARAVIDELTDRNVLAPDDIEDFLTRVTQRAHLAAEHLVWWSTETGQALLDGRAMTHQQAVHLCLTHTRNEIDQSQTTFSRIVYRTPGGAVCTYEGTLPEPTPSPASRGFREGWSD